MTAEVCFYHWNVIPTHQRIQICYGFKLHACMTIRPVTVVVGRGGPPLFL